MAKYNVKEIMRKAHKLAKELIGDYVARLSYALRQVWAEVKEMAEEITPFVDGEAEEVNGYYYHNAVTNPFTKSAYVAEFKDGILEVDYAEPEWGEKSSNGKRTAVTFKVQHGFTERDAVNIDLTNECIKVIQGETYGIKNIIKKFGFRWNREGKNWVR